MACVLTADAGALVAAEGGVSRVGVVAVRPHPPGLDPAAQAVRRVPVARPDACAEPVEGVVGDAQCLGVVVEGDAALRHAVLESGDADAPFDLSSALPEDAYVAECALDRLSHSDSRRGIVAARLDAVDD